MEYAEDDYLMISGIQHFRFCKRQWALIHIEQQWAENEHTVIGELMHKKAHDPYLTEKRRDTIIARALPVASREMGVTGECDVVEFHRREDGIRLHGHRGNNCIVWISGNKSGTYGCLCRTKYFPVLHDSPGKISGTGHRKSEGERDPAGTTVCQQQR